VNDNNLLDNKSGNRPYFLAFKDKNSNAIWMIPCTKCSQEKEKQIKKSNSKHKPPFRQSIVTVNGRKQILEFGNMFPIIEAFIKDEFLIDGKPGTLTDKDQVSNTLYNAKKTVNYLLHCRNNLTKYPPNIEKIIEFLKVYSKEQI
jgi:hypothetical protein